MSTSDILLAYAIILIFGLVFFYSFIIAAKSHIAKHWDEYKCSPMITPFSSYICPVGSPCQYTDPSGNVMARPSGIVFSKCIQDSQGRSGRNFACTNILGSRFIRKCYKVYERQYVLVRQLLQFIPANVWRNSKFIICHHNKCHGRFRRIWKAFWFWITTVWNSSWFVWKYGRSCRWWCTFCMERIPRPIY